MAYEPREIRAFRSIKNPTVRVVARVVRRRSYGPEVRFACGSPDVAYFSVWTEEYATPAEQAAFEAEAAARA